FRDAATHTRLREECAAVGLRRSHPAPAPCAGALHPTSGTTCRHPPHSPGKSSDVSAAAAALLPQVVSATDPDRASKAEWTTNTPLTCCHDRMISLHRGIRDL